VPDRADPITRRPLARAPRAPHSGCLQRQTDPQQQDRRSRSLLPKLEAQLRALAAEAQSAHNMAMRSKLRWGDTLDDEDILPPSTVKGPDDHGVKTLIDYYKNDKAEAMKKTTKVKVVTVEKKVYKVGRAAAPGPRGGSSRGHRGRTGTRGGPVGAAADHEAPSWGGRDRPAHGWGGHAHHAAARGTLPQYPPDPHGAERRCPRSGKTGPSLAWPTGRTSSRG
jgi:hypothetical protein